MGWYRELKETFEVYKERDPAIRTYWDVLLYPCYRAMRTYRKAHRLWESGHTFWARWLSQQAARKTGIEIHPGARIGKGFFIDHGTGVVIGETCEIGDNVTLYQGVTLGGTGKEQGKRHPTLEDGVMVSAGAKVLGSITVGKNSKIGAGAVVIKPVPPNCTVVGVPGRIVRMKNQVVPRDSIDQTNLPDPILQDMKVLQRANNELINRVLTLENEMRKLKKGKNEPEEAGGAGNEKMDLSAGEAVIKPDERDYDEVGACMFADHI
ncbi:MAG: serine O-acetyltransferase [Lachnospiraceae bacterium]|nr:serine O-acetyltransferase [Lachnospiraceae bacterium]